MEKSAGKKEKWPVARHRSKHVLTLSKTLSTNQATLAYPAHRKRHRRNHSDPCCQSNLGLTSGTFFSGVFAFPCDSLRLVFGIDPECSAGEFVSDMMRVTPGVPQFHDVQCPLAMVFYVFADIEVFQLVENVFRACERLSWLGQCLVCWRYLWPLALVQFGLEYGSPTGFDSRPCCMAHIEMDGNGRPVDCRV